MKQLITIAGFEKELLEAVKEVIKHPLKLADFMKIEVESKPETKPLMSFSWKSIRQSKSIFDGEIFDNMIEIDKENTIKLFSKAMSNELLDDDAILKLFNHIEDKNSFYKKIISFKTLLQCDKLNIPIWKIIKLNKDEEILLPLYVWNAEAIKSEPKRALDTEGKVNFFNKNISKWVNLETENMPNSELISRVAYRIATDQKAKNYIKSLGLKLDIDHDYIFNDGKRNNIKDLLFNKGLIKLIPTESKTNPLDLAHLVCSKIPSLNREQITTQKKFAKLWFKYLKETNFLYTDKIGNLANHTFKRSSQYYLPLIDIYNEKEPKFEKEFSFNKTQLALYKWLNLLYEKQVDFTYKNYQGVSALTDLLVYISLNNYNMLNEFLKSDNFMMKTWNNLSHKDKKDIFSQYISQWDKIEKLITPELSQQKYSFQNPHIISDIMTIFTSSDLLDSQEINSHLLNFFSQYENIKGISNTLKQINHQQFKLSYPEKEIVESRKIKI